MPQTTNDIIDMEKKLSDLFIAVPSLKNKKSFFKFKNKRWWSEEEVKDIFNEISDIPHLGRLYLANRIKNFRK